MSIDAIENALHAHLKNAPPGIDVAWPGLRYAPQADTPWMRVEFRYVPAPSSRQLLGTDALVTASGRYIMTLLYPVSQGPGPLRTKAAALESRFARRQTLSAGTAPNDFEVHLTAVARGSVRPPEEDARSGWNAVEVTVSWLCRHPQ